MDLDEKILSTDEKQALSHISRGLLRLSKHFNIVKEISCKHQEVSFIKLSKFNLYNEELPDGLYTFVSQPDFKNGNFEKRNTLEIRHADSGYLEILLKGRQDNPAHPFFTVLDFVGDDVIYVPASEYHVSVLG